MSEKVTLTVRRLPSGNYKLTEKVGSNTPHDVFSSHDKAAFYRRVAEHLAKRGAEGVLAGYEDAPGD